MRVKRSGAYGQEGIPLSSQWGRDSNFQTGRKRGGGLLTAVALILALGVIAVPTGLVATALSEEVHVKRERAHSEDHGHDDRRDGDRRDGERPRGEGG